MKKKEKGFCIKFLYFFPLSQTWWKELTECAGKSMMRTDSHSFMQWDEQNRWLREEETSVGCRRTRSDLF